MVTSYRPYFFRFLLFIFIYLVWKYSLVSLLFISVFKSSLKIVFGYNYFLSTILVFFKSKQCSVSTVYLDTVSDCILRFNMLRSNMNSVTMFAHYISYILSEFPVNLLNIFASYVGLRILLTIRSYVFSFYGKPYILRNCALFILIKLWDFCQLISNSINARTLTLFCIIYIIFSIV